MLPDGVTHTKGFVKDPDQAQRYLSLTDGALTSNLGAKVDMDHIEVTEKPEDRKRIDLTKNVLVHPIFLKQPLRVYFY